jgi:Rod binding domain-containing protein
MVAKSIAKLKRMADGAKEAHTFTRNMVKAMRSAVENPNDTSIRSGVIASLMNLSA